MRPRAAQIDQTGEFPARHLRGGRASSASRASPCPPSTAARAWTPSPTRSSSRRSRAPARTRASSCRSTTRSSAIRSTSSATTTRRSGSSFRSRAGEKLGCFALTEPDAGSDAGNQKTRAVREGDDYRISGQKVFITCGSNADVCLLFAMTNPEKKIKRHLGVPRRRGLARLRPLAPPGQARRQRLGHRRDLPDGRARPRRRPARRGGRRVQDRHVDARRRPHRHRGAGGRHRAGGLRGGGRATRRRAGPSASRSPSSRRCASTSPTWRPRSTPRAC